MDKLSTKKARKPRVDYKKLAAGPELPFDRKRSDTWSTRTFYRLIVIDSKLQEDTLLVYVHYIGWPSKYNEWRLARDILDIPEEFLVSSEEGRKLFFTNLRIFIKEALHCQRKRDSLVELRIQISKDIFEQIKHLGTLQKRGQYLLRDIRSFDQFLGANWNYRIVNQHKDFAFVGKNELFFRLSEREPLCEFDADGLPQYTHRGFVIVVKFIRRLGNRHDFESFAR